MRQVSTHITHCCSHTTHILTWSHVHKTRGTCELTCCRQCRKRNQNIGKYYRPAHSKQTFINLFLETRSDCPECLKQNRSKVVVAVQYVEKWSLSRRVGSSWCLAGERIQKVLFLDFVILVRCLKIVLWRTSTIWMIDKCESTELFISPCKN